MHVTHFTLNLQYFLEHCMFPTGLHQPYSLWPLISLQPHTHRISKLMCLLLSNTLHWITAAGHLLLLRLCKTVLSSICCGHKPIHSISPNEVSTQDWAHLMFGRTPKPPQTQQPTNQINAHTYTFALPSVHQYLPNPPSFCQVYCVTFVVICVLWEAAGFVFWFSAHKGGVCVTPAWAAAGL